MCAYCDAPATSVDHIPPKSIFAVRSGDLITVPSCNHHNHQQGQLDEGFRDFVAWYVGEEPSTENPVWDAMVRSVQRNRRKQRDIRSNSEWNADLGKFLVRISRSPVSPVLERITRGLYWHCYSGDRLRADR